MSTKPPPSPPPRRNGAVVQRRRGRGRTQGRQGANHSLYLAHRVWADLEALADVTGWSVARTTDGLLAMTLVQHSPTRQRDPQAELTEAEVRALAQQIVAFDMGQVPGGES